MSNSYVELMNILRSPLSPRDLFEETTDLKKPVDNLWDIDSIIANEETEIEYEEA